MCVFFSHDPFCSMSKTLGDEVQNMSSTIRTLEIKDDKVSCYLFELNSANTLAASTQIHFPPLDQSGCWYRLKFSKAP